MKFRPLGRRLVIKAEEEKKEETTKSGIILANSALTKSLKEYIVLKVSDKIDDISENDTVIISEYNRKPVLLEGIKCFIINYDEVLGVK